MEGLLYKIGSPPHHNSDTPHGPVASNTQTHSMYIYNSWGRVLFYSDLFSRLDNFKDGNGLI